MSKQQTAELLGLTVNEYDEVLYKAANYAGVIAERERIIKLLEDEQYHAIVTQPSEIGSGNEPITSHWATCEACRFIALIKGENK